MLEYAAMSAIIGCDLGGTKCALARYNAETFAIEAQEQWPTHALRGWESIFPELTERIRRMVTPETRGIGIGVPGLVRQPDGLVLTMPNIPGARDIPLRKFLQQEISTPIFVENDANCFTLAEATLGAGKDCDVVIGVTMGTGVGGGIVIKKQVFHGAHGFAAEVGHMLLMPGKPPFLTDDMRGDTEQFLSGGSWKKRCAQARRPEDYLEGAVCSFMHADVCRELAWLCTNLTHLLDPDIIIFGGSAGRALKGHFPLIEEEFRRWVLPGTPLPRLAIATMDHAPTLGAALLVRSS